MAAVTICSDFGEPRLKKKKNKKQKTKNTQFDHSLAGRKKGPGKMFKGDRKDEAVLDNSVVCHGLLKIRKAGCT